MHICIYIFKLETRKDVKPFVCHTVVLFRLVHSTMLDSTYIKTDSIHVFFRLVHLIYIYIYIYIYRKQSVKNYNM